jgi:hypothetical protein
MTGPGGAFGSGRVFDQSRGVPPLDTASTPGHLVAVTTWVHSDLLLSTQPYRVVGRSGQWRRHPLLLVGGMVVGVGAVATLLACLVIALLALVAWVSAHAVAVGAAVAAVAVTALMLLRALTQARHAVVPPSRGCCQWDDHRA